MNIKKLLGKRVQEVRRKNGLTQERLAELVGLDTSSVSNIENGKYFPTADNLDKILKVLKLSPEELFILSHHKNPDNMMEEMVEAMKQNEELVRLLYKFYNTVKY